MLCPLVDGGCLIPTGCVGRRGEEVARPPPSCRVWEGSNSYNPGVRRGGSLLFQLPSAPSSPSLWSQAIPLHPWLPFSIMGGHPDETSSYLWPSAPISVCHVLLPPSVLSPACKHPLRSESALEHPPSTEPGAGPAHREAHRDGPELSTGWMFSKPGVGSAQ